MRKKLTRYELADLIIQQGRIEHTDPREYADLAKEYHTTIHEVHAAAHLAGALVCDLGADMLYGADLTDKPNPNKRGVK